MLRFAERDFRELYHRNNKTNGHKNIRCFPECCQGGHEADGFCGQVLKVNVISAAPGDLIVAGEFSSVSTLRWPLDCVVDRAEFESLVCDAFDLLRPLVLGVREDGVFALKRSGWHYGFKANKHTSHVHHDFVVFGLLPISDSKLRVLDVVRSPSFRIISPPRARAHSPITSARPSKRVATSSSESSRGSAAVPSLARQQIPDATMPDGHVRGKHSGLGLIRIVPECPQVLADSSGYSGFLASTVKEVRTLASRLTDAVSRHSGNVGFGVTSFQMLVSLTQLEALLPAGINYRLLSTPNPLRACDEPPDVQGSWILSEDAMMMDFDDVVTMRMVNWAQCLLLSPRDRCMTILQPMRDKVTLRFAQAFVGDVTLTLDAAQVDFSMHGPLGSRIAIRAQCWGVGRVLVARTMVSDVTSITRAVWKSDTGDLHVLFMYASEDGSGWLGDVFDEDLKPTPGQWVLNRAKAAVFAKVG